MASTRGELEFRTNPQLVSDMKKYRVASDSLDTSAYAAIQVWAQAAETARTFQLEPMISVLRHDQFDTVMGRIGFDAKGDLTGMEPFGFYVWKAGKDVLTNVAKTPTQ